MAITECINPDEIKAGDLAAFLQGDAGGLVIRHIARCVACAEQVEQLRLVDAQLLAAFYREACPPAETLADFVLDRLPAPEKLRVAAHVHTCQACTEEVTAVRRLAADEPPSLLARLRETLAAALVVRPVVPAAMPARGTGWQERYESENMVVTLSAHASRLTGRVRRRKAPAGTNFSGQAWLISETTQADSEAWQSSIDPAGHFQFDRPAAGVYRLLLVLEELNLAVENIPIE